MLSINDKVKKMGMDKLRKIRKFLICTFVLTTFPGVGIILKAIYCIVTSDPEIAPWPWQITVAILLLNGLSMYILAFYIQPEIERRERDQQDMVPKK